MIKFLDVWDEDELMLFPVKLLTLGGKRNHKSEWIKNRGARIEQKYAYPNTDSYIREYYNYTYNAEKTEIVYYERKIQWVDYNGNIEFELDTTPDLTSMHLREVNTAARNNQIDYLEGAAFDLRFLSETVSEPYKSSYIQIADNLDLLMSHYGENVREYRERNIYCAGFELAVLNETDPNILAVLDFQSRPPDAQFPNGLTVKQSIMYQLKGIIP